MLHNYCVAYIIGSAPYNDLPIGTDRTTSIVFPQANIFHFDFIFLNASKIRCIILELQVK